MVPIMNVPFLARTLERLHEVGIRDVILPAGYLPEAITEYFGDGSQLDMKITYVIETDPLGTAGALKNVEEHITGPFFVLNGDVLTSLDLRAMMAYHAAKGGLGALHLIKVDDPSAFGCVVHDGEGRISAFVEKPPKGTAPTDEINAGTYLFEREVLDLIPPGRNVSIERETFPKILAEDRGLFAFTTDDYWIDLGKPEAYLAAHHDILTGAMPLDMEPGISGRGAAGVSHENLLEPVHVGAGVRIHPSAVVGPHVVLGDGCSIGAGAVIRDSVLWDGVTLEDGVSIVESIVASGARLGKGAQIGAGSVIGHDVAVEPGTVAAPNSRIGSPTPTGA
jgi:mannose-1-phosphate guanylyltransferase